MSSHSSVDLRDSQSSNFEFKSVDFKLCFHLFQKPTLPPSFRPTRDRPSSPFHNRKLHHHRHITGLQLRQLPLLTKCLVVLSRSRMRGSKTQHSPSFCKPHPRNKPLLPWRHTSNRSSIRTLCIPWKLVSSLSSFILLPHFSTAQTFYRISRHMISSLACISR